MTFVEHNFQPQNLPNIKVPGLKNWAYQNPKTRYTPEFSGVELNVFDLNVVQLISTSIFNMKHFKNKVVKLSRVNISLLLSIRRPL